MAAATVVATDTAGEVSGLKHVELLDYLVGRVLHIFSLIFNKLKMKMSCQCVHDSFLFQTNADSESHRVSLKATYLMKEDSFLVVFTIFSLM